jgi:hypothetical protein
MFRPAPPSSSALKFGETAQLIETGSHDEGSYDDSLMNEVVACNYSEKQFRAYLLPAMSLRKPNICIDLR